MTTSIMLNKNPPSTSDDRNGSEARVSSATPATASTHAATRRAGDRRLSHAPTTPLGRLTASMLTDH
jgi:hypothetical protein